MSDGTRKFRPKGPGQKARRSPERPSRPAAERSSPRESRTGSRTSETRRRPRRRASKKGLDPSWAVFIILVPVTIIGGLLMTFVTGRVEQRASAKKTAQETKDLINKTPEFKEAFKNNPVPEMMTKSQGNDIQEMLRITKFVADESREKMERLDRVYDETLARHEEKELLIPQDLRDIRERSRQRKIILALKIAARNVLNMAQQNMDRFVREIGKSTISKKTKANMLNMQKKKTAELANSMLAVVVKICEVELEILALVETHLSSMTITDSGGASFSVSTIEEQYSRLRAKHTALIEECEAKENAQ